MCVDFSQCLKLGLTYTDVCKFASICKYSTSNNDTGNNEDAAVNNSENEMNDDENEDDNTNIHSEGNDIKENKEGNWLWGKQRITDNRAEIDIQSCVHNLSNTKHYLAFHRTVFSFLVPIM